MEKMFENKNILILDDEQAILDCFEKIISKLAPNNNVQYLSQITLDVLSIAKELDAIILDFYFDRLIKASDIIKGMRKINPNMIIICCSAAFVSNPGDLKCVNFGIMKECLNAGANRAVPKDPKEILELLETHFKLRES